MDSNHRRSLQNLIKARFEQDGIRCNVFGHEAGDVIGFDPYGKYIAVKLGKRNAHKELSNGVRFIEASTYENFLTIYLTKRIPTEQPPQTLF